MTSRHLAHRDAFSTFSFELFSELHKLLARASNAFCNCPLLLIPAFATLSTFFDKFFGEIDDTAKL